MRAVVFNLGCKTNRYESDAMAEEFCAAGWSVFENLVPADVYILNTCAVTAEAEKKSRQAVARALRQNPNAKIYVCGCASQNSTQPFLARGVELVIGTRGKNQLVQRILADFANKNAKSVGAEAILTQTQTPRVEDTSAQTQILQSAESDDLSPQNLHRSTKADLLCDSSFLKDNSMQLVTPYEEFAAPPLVDKTRVTLKIQDGCNNFCAYCIIPYLRGRSRSRTPQSIVQEAQYLATKTQEIVLTGINLSAYGADIGTNLPALIDALSGCDVRLRLGSFYVEGVSDELLQSLQKLPHFCPHFHLSLQSGDDSVLRAMNRKYTTADYLAAVAKIRAYFPNAGMTTDVIVGYPTETEQNFENTLDFLKKVEFSDIHIFVYSKRNGTAAARLAELPQEVKEVRKARLSALKAELNAKFLQKNIGVAQNILIEEPQGEFFVGYSENYLRVYTKNAQPLQQIIPKSIYKDGLK